LTISRNAKVSIVIPTFNSDKTLDTCLQSIKSQTYPEIETIVVDSYSQDKTIRIAEKFNAKLLFLRSERCTARNSGAKQAKGSLVFFIDSDMELTPTVVEECARLCLRKNADAVIIPEESVGKGFLAECRKMEKEMRVDGRFSEAPRFFRKEVFDYVGGFDEKLIIGEDFDLGKRIDTSGYRIERCKAKIKHHEEEMSTKELVLKTYYYAKTLSRYLQKDPSLAIKTSCPIHITKNLKTICKYPAYFAGLLLLKLVEYMTYAVGIVSVFFSVQNPKNKRLKKTGNSPCGCEVVQSFPYKVSSPAAKRIELMFKYMGSEPVLDAGCGTGWLMAFLTRKGVDVVGLDLSQNSLQVFKRLFPEARAEAKIVLGSVDQIPFPNSHFGTVVLFDVLEHVKEISTVLCEVKRIAKKGGHILITLPNAMGSYSLINDMLKERMLMKSSPLRRITRYEPLKHHHEHVHHYSWWARLLEAHGFIITKHCNVEILTPLLSVFLNGESMKRMSYYDVEKADLLPRFVASEWFILCIKN